MRFATTAVHAGQATDPTTGAVIPPVHLTTTFEQAEPGVHKGYEYSRTGNPTRAALEECLAALCGGRYALAYASGLAATASVMCLFRPGARVVAGDDLYGGTYRLFEKVYRNWGVSFTYVDATDLYAVSRAVTPVTRLVWIETPTNPLLKVADIEKIAGIAKEAGAILAVDNTFLSPYFQRPLALGADIEVHSTTKYIGGHSDVVGGAVITDRQDLYDPLKFFQNAVGAVPAPFDCWLLLRGIKTLPLRMAEHEGNARAVAEFLDGHERVKRCIYPGLPSHPQHRLARRQQSGFGGVVTFELRGALSEAKRFLKNLRIFKLAESLGGVESLVEHPAIMTHAAVPPERRARLGITDSLIRASVGIEDPADLLEDLASALS